MAIFDPITDTFNCMVASGLITQGQANELSAIATSLIGAVKDPIEAAINLFFSIGVSGLYVFNPAVHADLVAGVNNAITVTPLSLFNDDGEIEWLRERKIWGSADGTISYMFHGSGILGSGPEGDGWISFSGLSAGLRFPGEIGSRILFDFGNADGVQFNKNAGWGNPTDGDSGTIIDETGTKVYQYDEVNNLTNTIYYKGDSITYAETTLGGVFWSIGASFDDDGELVIGSVWLAGARRFGGESIDADVAGRTTISEYNGSDSGSLRLTQNAFGGSVGLHFGSTTTAEMKADGNGFEFVSRVSFQANDATEAPTTQWDLNNGNIQRLILTGDRTLNFPQNLMPGSYTLFIYQDGVGGRTLAFDAGYLFPAGMDKDLSTDADALDVLTIMYDGGRIAAILTKQHE